MPRPRPVRCIDPPGEQPGIRCSLHVEFAHGLIGAGFDVVHNFPTVNAATGREFGVCIARREDHRRELPLAPGRTT